MQAALSLAQRNLGQTWPNPAVGAIVVKNGRIIGQGYTGRGGRPHAETIALAQAGETAHGATLYVTLEPCAHQGQTPPCTDAIIKAGIKKCVVACGDPNPQVNGKGIAQLKSADVEVTENICAAEAREINRGFFSVMQKKRPFIAMKIATSLDGKITLPPLPLGEGRGEGPHPNLLPKGEGTKQWLTGLAARNYGHKLRSQFDAIATGIGTVLADDPLLTCRLPGLEDRSPVRVIFDRQNRLPKDSQLAKTAKDVPLWIFNTTIEETLKSLTEKGITRLLIEAGAKLSMAFLQSGLVDRIYWFRAPIIVGEKGLSAFSEGLPAPWKLINRVTLTPDSLEIYECSPAS